MEIAYTCYRKWPKRWAQDGKVGHNGNDLMILNIVFHWGTFMSGRDLLLVFFLVICL